MKTYYFVIVAFAFSVSVVVILFLLTQSIVHERNPFVRQFPPHALDVSDSVQLEGDDQYYVSGITNSRIYLSGKLNGLKLKVLNLTNLRDSLSSRLEISNADKVKFWRAEVMVDSPHFFLTDGTTPAIFKGELGQSGYRFAYDSAFFSDIVPVTANSFAIKSLAYPDREYALGKQSLDTPHIKLSRGLLQKQLDGRFCVDGSMHFNSLRNWIVYTYFYRNEFLVIDTSLNLVSRFHTIDTVSKAQIQVGAISSEKSLTMVAPPLMVNRRTCTYSKWLFVNSSLLSNNESEQAFRHSSVIDVYDLATGNYRLSFYIEDYNSKKIQSIHVQQNKLVALFENHLRVYDLQAAYFPE